MPLDIIPIYTLPYFVGPASYPIKQTTINGLTSVVNGSPFKPDTMSQGSAFSNSRLIYKKTQDINRASTILKFSKTTGTKLTAYSLNKSTPSSSSQHIQSRRARAVGKSSIITTRDTTMGYKNYDKNDVRSAISRTRGGGSVAPKKKGAVRN
jgi:hypothetical protein